MKKASLKDLKKQNKALLLQLLAGNPGISRIGLAEKSSLSPATVSSLVAEMLESGLLTESGEEESTGGRKRVCLALNPGYAAIPVFEITRSGVWISVYDTCLRQVSAGKLVDGLPDGNTLFCRICEAAGGCGVPDKRPRRVMGLGIAYRDDLTEKDFSVMCSTSLSSETISLETALASELRIPVVSDCFGRPVPQPEKIAALFPRETVRGDYAFVHAGDGVWAVVFAGGKPLSAFGGDTFDLTPLWKQEEERARCPRLAYPSGETPPATETGAASAMIRVLFALHTFFPVKSIILDGACFRNGSFMGQLRGAWAVLFQARDTPKLCSVSGNVCCDSRDVMAAKVRRRAALYC